MTTLESVTGSPINYLKIFFRRKELIFIPAFIGLIAGICTGILLPKEYRSETTILVEEGKSDNPLFNQLAVSTTVQQRLASIRESILGWNSLVELVKRMGLDRNVKNKLEFERLILGLRGNVQIKLRGANVLQLAYVGKDPEQTQSVLKNITDIFIDRNILAQNRETSEAISFIEEQLKVYRGKIKSAEIAQFQEQLDILLIDSTEKHPLVQELKERINAKKAELKKENLQYVEDINNDQQSTKPMIEEIRKALDSLEKQTKGATATAAKKPDAQLMVNVNLDEVVARDIGVNQKIYATLLQRLETAKITQRLQESKEGTRYEILDPPRIPLEPFKPNKLLVALVGLLLGAAAGVGLIFGLEFLDKSFIDVEEAKDYLGVALFGAISRINTPESIRREKESVRWLYGLTLFIGILVVVVTVSVARYLK